MDYKILSKALSNLLIPLLVDLIRISQTGFMENRNIAHNIRKIIALINYADEEKLEAVLISLDFEKAFDKVEMVAIEGSLRYFNFGPRYNAWIKLLFAGFQSCMVNYGYISDWFTPTRGLHQGTCKSPYIFLLNRAFGNINTQGKKLKGIKVRDYEFKSVQFTDNMNLPLMGDIETLNTTISILQKYQYNTGFKLNFEKSNLLRIGVWRNTDIIIETTQQLCWTNGKINVLGIDINTDCDNSYTGFLEKIQVITEDWRNKGLSLIGKTIVLNTLVGSLFVCKMNVLPNMSKMSSMKTAMLRKEEGGLKLFNLAKKQDA